MKHTDFYPILKAIKLHERQELIAAVIAHGGMIEFAPLDENGNYDDANSDCPIVMAAAKYDEQAMDYNIVKVTVERVNGHDWLTIYGIEKEYGRDPQIVDVCAGHIDYIIDCIPDTKSVKDVTIPLTADELLNNKC